MSEPETGAPVPRDARTHRFRIEAGIVAVAVFALLAATHPDAVATLGRLYDDVVYLSVGKSIADGDGYRSAQLVGSPVHVKFPPLLPAIYAIAWRVFGSLRAVASTALWLNIIIASAASGVLWLFARAELRVGVAVAMLFVVVPLLTDRTMFYFSGAMSEPWMLLAWAVALVLAARLVRARAEGAESLGVAAALGVVLAVAMLARTQSAAFVMGVLAGVVVKRVGWRMLGVIVATTVLPLLGWRVWHGAMMARGPLSPLPDQVSYLSWIPAGFAQSTDFIALMARLSVPLYWANAAELLVGWTSPKTLAFAGALLAMGVIGLAMLVRRSPALVASVCASLGLIIVWPYVQDRFLTPLLPVLGLAGAYAAQRLLDYMPRQAQRAAAAGVALLAAAVLGINIRARMESAHGLSRSAFVIAMNSMVEWIERHASPRDHVMASWGGAIYLRTGRQTSIPNPEEAALAPSVFDAPRQFLATRLLEDSVDVVVIWDRAPGRAAAWLRGMAIRCPGLMTQLPGSATTVDLRFYRVRRDVPCLRQLAAPRVESGTGNNNAP